jgi:hypothetical protein
MFFTATEAQTYHCRVVKLCFLASCFEYQDLFIGNRIIYPSESYLFAACVYSYLFVGFCYRYSRESSKTVLAEKFSSVKTCSVSRIAYPSVSYLSQKVMSEVSVSWRRRSSSARSALPLTCTPSFSGSRYRSSRKARKMFWQKDFFRGKF